MFKLRAASDRSKTAQVLCGDSIGLGRYDGLEISEYFLCRVDYHSLLVWGQSG